MRLSKFNPYLNAIMRGELSPPSPPTPNNPVGGEIVLSRVPNLAGTDTPGTPGFDFAQAERSWDD